MSTMKEVVTITQQEFKNRFDGVLLNNPTIHKILSKESNLGFTTQLVLDQLKAELTDLLFAETETPKKVEEPAEETEVEEETEEPDASAETTDTEGGDIDELDELD